MLVAYGPDYARWPDPSEDLLFMLLQDLIQAGPGAQMLIQRSGSPDEECLFIMRLQDSFGVLRHDGDGHAVASSGSPRRVHAACTRWAHRLDERAVEKLRAGWGGFDGTLDWHPESSGAEVTDVR